MASFQNHLEYTSSECRPFLQEIDRYVRTLSLGYIVPTATPEQRIAYGISYKAHQFLEVKVEKEAILVRFKRTILRDPQHKIREIPPTHEWPWECELRVCTEADVEYAKPFITAAYEKGLAE
jgi:predicted transport protein